MDPAECWRLRGEKSIAIRCTLTLSQARIDLEIPTGAYERLYERRYLWRWREEASRPYISNPSSGMVCAPWSVVLVDSATREPHTFTVWL